jgi:NitT/TauT family transport system substrate-binding protein
VKENPKTIAAFQRGTELALSDRALVEPILVEFSGVDEETAKNATLLDFRSELDTSESSAYPT